MVVVVVYIIMINKYNIINNISFFQQQVFIFVQECRQDLRRVVKISTATEARHPQSRFLAPRSTTATRYTPQLELERLRAAVAKCLP